VLLSFSFLSLVHAFAIDSTPCCKPVSSLELVGTMQSPSQSVGVCCCRLIGCVYPTLSNSALCLSCSSRSLSCVRAGVDPADSGSDAGWRLSHSLPLVQRPPLCGQRRCRPPPNSANGTPIGAIRMSGAMDSYAREQRRIDCDNVHRQQCAATVASLPSRPPPPQTSVRTIRPPELTPNRGHMHSGATGNIPHA